MMSSRYPGGGNDPRGHTRGRQSQRLLQDADFILIGVIKGQTANISISGIALLLFCESPDIGDEFEITIKLSEEHEAPVTCEKIWMGPMVTDETVYTAIGVRFIMISPRDREIIASMVEEYSVA